MKCTIQTKVIPDIKKVNESNELLVAADKLRNTYTMQKDNYSKYARDNLTKTYKRSRANRVKNTTQNQNYWQKS